MKAVKAIPFEFTQTTSKLREIMCKVGILNLYKINIQQVLTFMFTVKIQTIPAFFLKKVMQIHKYPAGFSHGSFEDPNLGIRLTKNSSNKYSIKFRNGNDF